MWPCDHASISKHELLQKLIVTHTESQSIEKSTRKQRKKALGHGISNEALAIEKNQIFRKYKLNRPVKMRGAGIIIPFQIS